MYSAYVQTESSQPFDLFFKVSESSLHRPSVPSTTTILNSLVTN